MTKEKYGKIISYATAVLIALCGIALIICAAHLFFTGGQTPYSRERVGKYLSYLTVPAIITVLLIIAGKVLDVISEKKSSEKSKRTEYEMISGFADRFNIDELDEETKNAILTEQNYRFAIKFFCHIGSFLFAISAVIYISFFAKFTVSNLTGDVLTALAVTMPLLVLAVGAQIPRVYLCEASARSEKELWLKVMKSGQKPATANRSDDPDTGAKRLLIVRVTVITLSVLLIVLGIFNGGMSDVLAKAVKICTECIGLG